MSVYYSSETSIESKVKAARVKLWGDRDRSGTLDVEVLTAALKYAKNLINAYLIKAYGAQVSAWDSTTVPPVIADISDDFTLYYIASGCNAMSPQIQKNYDNSMQTLVMLRDGEISIISTTGTVVGDSTTSPITVSTENEPRVFPRRLLQTAPSSFQPRTLGANTTLTDETFDEDG
jgi:phage gp36-like protein